MATLTSIDPLSSYTTLGEMLHYLRRQARLSQRELAIAVGYSESMISRLENGERPPDVATIHTLAAIGEAARRSGKQDTAGRLLSAAAAAEDRRQQAETQIETWDKASAGLFNEVADFNRIMAATPVYGQEPAFSAAWQEGQSLAMEEAVELALSW